MEFFDEIMFIGVDIPKAVKKVLDQADKDICIGMTANEKEAYDFGVKTTLSVLEGVILPQEDYEVCVHIPGEETDYGQEMDYAELKKLILE